MEQRARVNDGMEENDGMGENVIGESQLGRMKES
jgi:hypothetical protein